MGPAHEIPAGGRLANTEVYLRQHGEMMNTMGVRVERATNAIEQAHVRFTGQDQPGAIGPISVCTVAGRGTLPPSAQEKRKLTSRI